VEGATGDGGCKRRVCPPGWPRDETHEEIGRGLGWCRATPPRFGGPSYSSGAEHEPDEFAAPRGRSARVWTRARRSASYEAWDRLNRVPAVWPEVRRGRALRTLTLLAPWWERSTLRQAAQATGLAPRRSFSRIPLFPLIIDSHPWAAEAPPAGAVQHATSRRSRGGHGPPTRRGAGASGVRIRARGVSVRGRRVSGRAGLG
jgi:hypothetical protein